MSRSDAARREAQHEGQHLCHIYDSSAALSQTLIPYLLEGLGGGEACVCVLEPQGAAWVERELHREGLDVDAAAAAGRLRFETEQTGRRAAGVEADRLVEGWRAARDDALAGGFAGLRVAVDVNWAAAGSMDPDTLEACESALDRLASRRGLNLACLFDRRALPSQTIERLLASHPVVLWNGNAYANFYYEPSHLAAEERGTRLQWKLDRLAENRQLVEELTEASARQAAVLATLPVGVFIADEEGRLVDVNHAAQQLWGHAPLVAPESFGLYRAWWPESGAPVAADDWGLARAVASGESSGPEELEIESSTGERRVILNYANPVRGSDGRRLGAVAVNVDITERKQMEAELARSQERYQRLFDANPHPLWVYDRETLRFLTVNSAAVAKYGYSREAFLGMTIFDIRTPAEADRLRRYLAERPPGHGSAGIWTHRLSDGRLIQADIVAYTLEFAGRPAELVHAQDVTSRLEAEAALRASERLFRAIFDQAAVGIALIGPDGTSRLVNPALQSMLGYSEAELRDRTIRDLLHPADRARAEAQFRAHLTQDDGPRRSVWRFLDSSGDVVWAEASATALKEAGERPTSVVAVVKDITHQKRAEAEREELLRREQELRHAAEASSRAKSEFLSVISHELRTPLATASAFAEVLEAQAGESLTEPQRAQLRQVQASIWQLDGLVSEILDYTRVERGQLTMQPQEVDALALARAVVEQMEPLATAKRLRIEAASPLGRVPVVTDPARVKQILLNLVSNAVKFTESGEVRLVVTAPDQRVRFAVSDTGQGIAPEHLDRVFDPFWQVESPMTRRYGGTGLGLAISRSLAELLDGSLDLVSHPERGSTFTLTLPLRLRPRARSEGPDA